MLFNKPHHIQKGQKNKTNKIFNHKKIGNWINVVTLICIIAISTSCQANKQNEKNTAKPIDTNKKVVDNKSENNTKKTDEANQNKELDKKDIEIAIPKEFNLLPETVLTKAKELIENNIKTQNITGSDENLSPSKQYKVTSAELVKLTEKNVHDKQSGLDFVIYYLDYRLGINHIENVVMAGGMTTKDNKLTASSSMGLPVLIYIKNGENLKYITTTHDGTMNEDHNTIFGDDAKSKLLYPNPELAGCIESYNRYIKNHRKAPLPQNIYYVKIEGMSEKDNQTLLHIKDISNFSSRKSNPTELVKLNFAERFWAYVDENDVKQIDYDEHKLNYIELNKDEFIKKVKSDKFKNKIFALYKNNQGDIVNIIQSYTFPTNTAENLSKEDLINNFVSEQLRLLGIDYHSNTDLINPNYHYPTTYKFKKAQLIDSYDKIIEHKIYEIWKSGIILKESENGNETPQKNIPIFVIIENENGKAKLIGGTPYTRESDNAPVHNEILFANYLDSNNALNKNQTEKIKLMYKNGTITLEDIDNIDKIQIINSSDDIPKLVQEQAKYEIDSIVKEITDRPQSSLDPRIDCIKDSKITIKLHEKFNTPHKNIENAIYKVNYFIETTNLDFIKKLYDIEKVNGNVIELIKEKPNPYIIYEKNTETGSEKISLVTSESQIKEFEEKIKSSQK